MRHERDNFRNKREMNNALYRARLILRRKRVTLEEMRHAGEIFNKAVRTLQGWLNNINYHQRTKAEDAEAAASRRLNSLHRDEPLIPLSFK